MQAEEDDDEDSPPNPRDRVEGLSLDADGEQGFVAMQMEDAVVAPQRTPFEEWEAQRYNLGPSAELHGDHPEELSPEKADPLWRSEEEEVFQLWDRADREEEILRRSRQASDLTKAREKGLLPQQKTKSSGRQEQGGRGGR